MLMRITLQNENFQEFLSKIKDFISISSGTQEIKPMLRILSIILTFEIQPEAYKYESRCKQFYDGLTYIIEILTI